MDWERLTMGAMLFLLLPLLMLTLPMLPLPILCSAPDAVSPPSATAALGLSGDHGSSVGPTHTA